MLLPEPVSWAWLLTSLLEGASLEISLEASLELSLAELSATEDSGAEELAWEEELFPFPPHAVRERTITKDKSKESVRFIRFIPFNRSLFLFITLLENLVDFLVRQAFVAALGEWAGLGNLF